MRPQSKSSTALVALFLSMICVSGIVTDEGVECRAMRGDDGQLFTFRSLPDEIAVGDRIEVEGEPMPDSTCQQGTTLQPSRIVRPAAEGRPQREWK